MLHDRETMLGILAGSVLTILVGPMSVVAHAQEAMSPDPCKVLAQSDVEAVVGEASEKKREPAPAPL
jgi:hypothetical protein